MVRGFEELSNNAWPALQTLQYDGWTLRIANGVTKRSNSVNMLYPSTLNPLDKIAFCEQFYLARGLPACFKVTGLADPPQIDDLLESLGYAVHSVISFQVKDLGAGGGDPSGEIRLENDPRVEWMDDFIRMNGFDPARRETYLAILSQVLTPKCLASKVIEGKTVAVGLAVAERGYAGLFDIVVDPAHRHQGLGYNVVNELLCWGRRQGAHTAYLQVLADNAPALGLYRKMGFTEAYRYWYRMKP